MNISLDQNKKQRILFFFLLIAGILVRGIDFGNAPAGFNQDEAFAGYQAYSLLHYGVDAAGYHNPCYFVAWGSGMNVLESYLAIPFMKLFGCSVVTLRLPQLLLSCLSLVVFYLLLKEIFSERTALLGLGLLAISPWHIMLGRWGLESNLAPAFLLFGLYFFVKGIKNNRYWLLSALMYGISLYAYAITWVIVPVTIFLFGLYLIVTKQKIRLRYILLSGAVLFVLALPLLLFVLVNKGIIPEIHTDFFSVPKLLAMRDAEISLKNLLSPQSYTNLFRILIGQNDGLIINTTDFGLFYKISFPFMLLGGVKLGATVWKSFRAKHFCYETVILFGFFCSIISCLLINELNVNKANSLHFYTLVLIVVGVKEAFLICKNHFMVKRAIVCGYALLFVFFASYYFGSYQDQISTNFLPGVEGAVKEVKTRELSEVYVDSSISYSQVLFFDQTPTDVFLDTVEYTNYPAAYLDVKKFEKYYFGIDYESPLSHEAYIIKSEKTSRFLQEGYQISEYGNYALAYRDIFTE